MSETSVKTKDALQELDFLNGEVGRVKKVLESVKIEIEEYEVQKAIVHKELMAESSSKVVVIEGLDKQIKSRKEDFALINSDIGSAELILEDKRKELVISDLKIKQNEENGKKLSDQLEERRSAAKSAEEKAKLFIKEFEEKQKSLNEREKELDNKESSITGTISSLEKERNDVKKLQISLQEKINQTEELKRTLESKKNNTELLEKDYTEKLLQHKLQSDELLSVITRNNNIANDLDKRMLDIKIKEEEISKQRLSLASKEADLVLRERECKIREKTLSIEKREEQLD